jgi:hypothetical protein
MNNKLQLSIEIDVTEVLQQIINEVGMNGLINSLNKMDQNALISALTEEVNDGTFPMEMLVGRVVVSRMAGRVEQKNNEMNKNNT